MADIRSHPEQDEEHEGASPGELLIEAARRNNTDLLKEVIDGCKSEEEAAKLLNETKTVLGNYVYHEAALRGNYEIIDALLDHPGFECDPISRIEGDTPLHSAIRYINTMFSESPSNQDIQNFASELISMMIEAGSDPKLKNKANLTPYQLVDPRNEKLRQQIQDAIDVETMRGDYIETRDEYDEVVDGDVGSASDSDFDPEEYRREKERRDKAKRENGGA
ncbi:related to Drosophila ANK protein [Phialocephala subalpina]|uniref:Related to Drosophila ANK protein n=1 Tax=Phialocephala subalpina TaxID=576137 RepID=A0A1L7WFG2_9HELO|nr:related to Drosophila ANK protein [Phialocephala subalpina]